MLSRFLMVFILTGIFLPVQAKPPVPEKKQSIGEIEKILEQEKSEKEKLHRKMTGLEKELEETRKKMVSVSKGVQQSESNLQLLERKLEELEEEKKILNESLEEDKKSMAMLILALQRIRRVPPEAIFARPGAPLKTAQSAMLLSDIIPVLDKKAENLKASLARLSEITQTIKEDRAEAIATAQKLKEEQKALEKLITRRKKLYASTHQDLKATQATIARISAQAKNMRDLIRRLNENRERTRNQLARKKQVRQAVFDTGPLTPLPPASSSSEARLPVSGILKIAYNQKDAFGAPSRGITITGRNGGLVVAPMSGQVRFAGPFKNYGKLVVLEHQGGYHSLIAGLDNIEAVIGQNVTAGEPVGNLKNLSNQGKPTLYYELRLNGRPINPSRKFADLG